MKRYGTTGVNEGFIINVATLVIDTVYISNSLTDCFTTTHRSQKSC